MSRFWNGTLDLKKLQWFNNTTRRPVSLANGVMHGMSEESGAILEDQVGPTISQSGQ